MLTFMYSFRRRNKCFAGKKKILSEEEMNSIHHALKILFAPGFFQDSQGWKKI